MISVLTKINANEINAIIKIVYKKAFLLLNWSSKRQVRQTK